MNTCEPLSVSRQTG